MIGILRPLKVKMACTRRSLKNSPDDGYGSSQLLPALLSLLPQILNLLVVPLVEILNQCDSSAHQREPCFAWSPLPSFLLKSLNVVFLV